MAEMGTAGCAMVLRVAARSCGGRAVLRWVGSRSLSRLSMSESSSQGGTTPNYQGAGSAACRLLGPRTKSDVQVDNPRVRRETWRVTGRWEERRHDTPPPSAHEGALDACPLNSSQFEHSTFDIHPNGLFQTSPKPLKIAILAQPRIRTQATAKLPSRLPAQAPYPILPNRLYRPKAPDV